MSERETNWLIIFLSLLLLAVSFWTFGCGIQGNFQEIRPDYLLNVDQPGTDQIKDLMILAVDTYDAHFGHCPHKVDIVMRKWGFDCGGGVLAAGCSFGGLIDIGVHHTSECETIRVTLHELSHACRYLPDPPLNSTEPNWTWELNDITYAMSLRGECIVSDTELYSNYVWE